MEREQRVAVDQPVEAFAADAEAGDDLALMDGLAPSGDHALLHQRHDRIGDHVGVDAEVAPVLEVPHRLAGNAAEADLQRGAVADDAGDIAGDLAADLVGGLVRIFDDRHVRPDEPVDAVDVQEGLAHGAGHVRVDLGDDPGRIADRGAHDVDRDAEADIAVAIGSRDLDERGVDRDPAVLQKCRHPGDRDRNVVGLALRHREPVVGADEERVVVIAGADRIAVGRDRAVGKEMIAGDVRRRRPPLLERSHQATRRRAGGADEDMLARSDICDRLLGRHQLAQHVVGQLRRRRCRLVASHGQSPAVRRAAWCR